MSPEFAEQEARGIRGKSRRRLPVHSSEIRVIKPGLNLVGGSVRRERRPMKSEVGLHDVKARTGANRCLRQAIRAVRFGLLRSRTIDARISSTVEQRVRLFVRLIKLGLKGWVYTYRH